MIKYALYENLEEVNGIENVAEGCTFATIDGMPFRIGLYETKEQALEELAKHKSTWRKLARDLYRVQEYWIEPQDLDEENNDIGAYGLDPIAFSKFDTTPLQEKEEKEKRDLAIWDEDED